MEESKAGERDEECLHGGSCNIDLSIFMEFEDTEDTLYSRNTPGRDNSKC